MANNMDRKTWMFNQRQRLGPDWVTRMRADELNKNIEKLIRDIYFGNIGETNIQTNPDFMDLCSVPITDALLGYYTNKYNMAFPLYNIVQQWKQLGLNRLNSIGEEFRQAERDKFLQEVNSMAVLKWLDETMQSYYEIICVLTNYKDTGYQNYACIDRLVGIIHGKYCLNPNFRII